MKLKNYLNEEKNIDDFIINHPLTKIYEQTSKKFYRGTRSLTQTYIIKKRRTDRFPKDMDVYLHSLFDKSFQQKFGWKVRSTGVFVISSENDASFFGAPYIFLPYSTNYNFVYSTIIRDLTSQTNAEHYDNRVLSQKDAEMLERPTSYKQKDIIKIMDKIIKTYTDKDVKKALRLKNEVVFDVDQYLLINEKYYNQIMNKLNSFGFLK